MARKKLEENLAATPSPQGEGDVLVANQHTGGIVFPRKSKEGLYAPPLRLAPGTVTAIPHELWEKYKKMPLVQAYLDKRLLVQVKRAGAVPMLDAATSDLPIPENLLTDADKGVAKASVKRETLSEATISE